MTNELETYPLSFSYCQKFSPSDLIKVQIFFPDIVDSEVLTLEAFDEYGVLRESAPFLWDTLGAYTYANAELRCSEGVRIIRIFYKNHTAATYIVEEGTDREVEYDVLDGDVSSFTEGKYYFYKNQIYKALSNGSDKPDIGDFEIVVLNSEICFSEIVCETLPVEVGYFPDTILVGYHHSVNDFETIFGDFDYNTFTIRIEGSFPPDQITPRWDSSLFSNQKMEDEVTYSLPYMVYRLMIGDSLGLPSYMIEKLNYILACDTILINWTHYTRMGELELTTTDYHTLIAGVDMKRKTNSMLQTGGEIIITDENKIPITNEDYNILTL